jgi:hypothetical protein
MAHNQTAWNDNPPGRKATLWSLAALSVAGLANLTVLGFVVSSGNMPLIGGQMVAIGAGLIAAGLVFRGAGYLSHTGVGEDIKQARGEAPPGENALENKRWLGLVEETVTLLAELEKHSVNLDPAAREVAEHVALRLQEILERSGVSIIEGDATYEQSRHQTEHGVPQPRPGAAVGKTLRPGLAVGRRIFRRALVRLKPPSPDGPTATT